MHPYSSIATTAAWQKKQNNTYPNRWIYCDVKSTLDVSVSITISRALISEKLFTQRWMLIEITGANEIYRTKRYKRAHSVLNSKVLRTCFARGKIFENVGFFQETRKILPSLKEILKGWLVFIYTDRFEIIHVRCRVRMYYSVFSAIFILSDFDPYLLSYIYIYIERERERLFRCITTLQSG